jgi:hypothetical protein
VFNKLSNDNIYIIKYNENLRCNVTTLEGRGIAFPIFLVLFL